MAEIAPFRGLLYSTEKIPDLSKVVIPPYDVISPKEQEWLHELSPYNMVRLELGKATPGDSTENNAHTRAASYFHKWQEEKILIRDDQPAVYYYELDYALNPQMRQTRYGFICLLRLEDFSGGRVRPHEKTFKAVRDERLALMRSCRANLSPVFALYADPSQLVDHHLKSGRESQPFLSFKDYQGMEHRLWRVKNLNILRQVRALMLDKAIFIADGHHRYETALAYRSIQRETYGVSKPHASFEYIMVYLSNLNQGGLIILPTHRLLRHLPVWEQADFLKKLRIFFDVLSHEPTESGQLEWRSQLEAGRARKETVIGFYSRNADSFFLLKAKREPISSYLAHRGLPEVLHSLDVVVLDQIVLRQLMGLAEDFLASEQNIHFKHDLIDGLLQVQSGAYEAGFFINPTRIEQVQEVASCGLIMPHKSTYFYPKVWSGVVIHPLRPEEEIFW